MNMEFQAPDSPSINGHMFDLGAAHSIAIYERNGDWYVAEFRHGRGAFMSAGTWFRFHAGCLSYCHNGRAALRSSVPLVPRMLQKIERLHRESDARQARMLAAPGNVARSVKGCVLSLLSRARGISPRLIDEPANASPLPTIDGMRVSTRERGRCSSSPAAR